MKDWRALLPLLGCVLLAILLPTMCETRAPCVLADGTVDELCVSELRDRRDSR